MRKGFSLVTAIFMMAVIAVLGVAILSLAAMANAQKSQAFLRAQAELFARSATEFAILKISEHGAAMPQKYEIEAYPFHITVHTQMITDAAEINGTAVVDTFITLYEGFIDNQHLPLRFHRRTVQQP
ncbi:MAG: hypothetical protein LBN32_05035 [Helicobacteraceae bacterium]|jgi:type II secretory pathway pseudopilin PulG|nr:hypothetical protein [Helicobacteraceae bacterium]